MPRTKSQGVEAKRRARSRRPHALRRLVGLTACGVQLALTTACAQVSPALHAAAPPPDAAHPVLAPSFPPFAHAPLDTPLVVTGTFGDRRGGHFHAGLDLSTGEIVGKPVYAPAPAAVVRVRTSGVGYGRSLYLKTDDGRLVVYGHLDAFAEPLASYVDSLQRTSGRYEQDLWPPASKFRVAPGAIVAWSGQSGAGPPHLHAEIRIVDMAHHPLRAGWPLADAAPPRIDRITLVPVDDSSRVAGTTAPYTRSTVEGDTVVVEGRFEVRVEAGDALGSRRGLAPWSTVVQLGDRKVECRFDSVSWAGDMSDAAYVYDGDAVRLAAPEGARPRVLNAEWPSDGEGLNTAPQSARAGEFDLDSSAPTTPLDVTVRDVAGNVASRRLWVRPPRATDRVAALPDTHRAVALRDLDFDLSPAGHGCVRVVLSHAPRESRAVWIGLEGGALVPAGRVGAQWSGLLCPRTTGSVTVVVVGVDHAPWRTTQALNLDAVGLEANAGRNPSTEFRWSHGKGSVFESGALAVSHESTTPTGELVPVSDVHALEPEDLPLRSSWTVTLSARSGADTSRVAVYRRGSRNWEWAGAERDLESGTWSASTRRLGAFALFRDVRAPVIHLLPASSPSRAGPYSRWTIEARIDEQGSGVEAERSQLFIDEKPVPTEWDPDAGRLRWRPFSLPARGEHAVRVRAVDRAGNVSEASGRFDVE